MDHPVLTRPDALALSWAGAYPIPDLLDLVHRSGGLERLSRVPEGRLLARQGMGPKRLKALRRAFRADPVRIEERIRAAGLTAHVLGEPAYPPTLLMGVEPPIPVLYVRGEPAVLVQDAVAIVGTRRPSTRGRRTAHTIARDLAGTGLPIVSGLAMGIDTAAHEGCMDGRAPTVAVLAHGLHTVSPAMNRPLARRIVEEGGALVSEYPPGTEATRHAFIPRNRIIAGLCAASLVVEGAERSGARHTAEYAQDFGRVVLAVPGHPDEPLAALPDLLIREHGAELCRGAADVLASLRPDRVDGVRAALEERARILRIQAERAVEALGPSARTLMDLIGSDPIHADTLSVRSGLPIQETLSLLLRMEIEGIVEQLPGMRYMANIRLDG